MASTVGGTRISLQEAATSSDVPIITRTPGKEQVDGADTPELPAIGTALQLPGEALSTLGDPLLSANDSNGTDDGGGDDDDNNVWSCYDACQCFMLVVCPFIVLAKTLQLLQLDCFGSYVGERGSRQAMELSNPMPVMTCLTLAFMANCAMIFCAVYPPYEITDTISFVGQNGVIGIFLFAVMVSFRTRMYLRHIHRIESCWCGDLLVTVLCFHSSIWQMAQSVRRGRRTRSHGGRTTRPVPRDDGELERTAEQQYDSNNSVAGSLI